MADNTPTPVDAVDQSKNTSTILESMGSESTVRMDLQDAKCYWNDAEFSQGEQVTLEDKCYECSFGRWVKVED
jgi:hypothetical protein